MPATDQFAPEYRDLRHYSSLATLNCPTHGKVYIVKIYNQDWNRAYCADCVEVEDARSSKRVTVTGL
jgi:hypothetical protein